MSNGTNSLVSWLALIIAIIALILAWTAFNRAGTDLEEIIEREVNQAVVELDAKWDAAEAEIRQDAAAGLDAAADDVAEDEKPDQLGE